MPSALKNVVYQQFGQEANLSFHIYAYVLDTLLIRYIDPPRHNFENCLIPCFVPYSCLGRPLAAWLAQVAVRDKTR